MSVGTVRHVSTQRALLEGAIDYAGLFPPAGLSMVDAARNFLDYAASSEAWALGRFVVPAGRLAELVAAAAPVAAPPGFVWSLSVVVGSNPSESRQAIDALASRGTYPHRVDAVETKAGSVETVEGLRPLLSPTWTVYVEIPYGGELEPLVNAVKGLGACVKLRTGSTSRDGFPSADDLARAVVACRDAGVPFKATAGLHHPLRAEHPLTYAIDAERGMMFGYLNLVLAAALAVEMASVDRLAAVLDERDPAALTFTEDGVWWQGHRLTSAAIQSVRRSFFHGFGSCSFREPMDEFPLVEAHVAPPR